MSCQAQDSTELGIIIHCREIMSFVTFSFRLISGNRITVVIDFSVNCDVSQIVTDTLLSDFTEVRRHRLENVT